MASTLLLALLANGAATLPLPDRLDVPESYSTVLCPSEAAARTMVAEYHRVKPAPLNHTLDTDRFFAGLRATGCTQDSPRSGSIVITAAVQRFEVPVATGKETYLLYRGTMGPERKPVIGIVDEGGANRAPRTELAEWKDVRTTDGWLDVQVHDPANTTFYRCDSAVKASAVVKAMQGMSTAASTAFQRKLKQQLSLNGCRPARESYFVTALRERAGNECGDECFVDLTALEAIDRSGLTVGLVFDGSLM